MIVVTVVVLSASDLFFRIIIGVTIAAVIIPAIRSPIPTKLKTFKQLGEVEPAALRNCPSLLLKKSEIYFVLKIN
jgi:hypothetical protein